MKYQPGRYAAIDIGTVTCRMLVADVDAAGTLTELAKEYTICNLGEGVDATGRLRPDAIERVLSAIDRYLVVRDSYQEGEEPLTTIALATSAARDAENGADFIEALAAHGLPLTIIPGSREAGLSFLGAGSAFTGETILMVDIGGGSTEVAWGPAGGLPVFSRSFDVGCRRMTERFFLSDPPRPEEMEAARDWARTMMEPFFTEHQEQLAMTERLVAVAGTATTVVSVREAMERYDSALVHKATVLRQDVADLEQQLGSLPLEQRRAVVGLDPGRAPVIVAGMVMLGVVMDLAAQETFTVSEADILDGMTLTAAEHS